MLGEAHACVTLVHIELASITVVHTWRLVVIRLCEVHHRVVRWRSMETRELSALRLTERSTKVSLLIGRSLARSPLALHVDIGGIHRIALHIRTHIVDLVVGHANALTHEVVVDEVSIATGHLVVLIHGLLLLRVLQLGRLVGHGVGDVHGLALHVVALAGCSLVLLLRCAAGGTRQAITKLVVLLLLLIDIVDVLRGVHGVHLLLGVADQLIYSGGAGVVLLSLVDLVVGKTLTLILDAHRHSMRV